MKKQNKEHMCIYCKQSISDNELGFNVMQGYFHKSCANKKLPAQISFLAPIGSIFNDSNFQISYAKIAMLFSIFAWISLLLVGFGLYISLKDKTGIAEFIFFIGVILPIIVGPILYSYLSAFESK